jgi:uncharacterized protein
MTYKRADRPGWQRLRAQRFICQRIADGRVNGYATLLHMLEVSEPLWVMHHEQRIRIADAGYSWLQIFPEGANYTHTTMFDSDGEPVQEYIDLVAEQGVGEDGIPWYDDLYLDITWIPEGTPLLLDQEELEAAHAIGAITEEQYELARGETARLLVALTLGDYTLPEVARACYPALRAALDVAEMNATASAEAALSGADGVDALSDPKTIPEAAKTNATTESSENTSIPDDVDSAVSDDATTTETPTTTSVPGTPDASSAGATDEQLEQNEHTAEQSLEDGEQHA